MTYDTKALGDRGEDLAACRLKADGYRILARNYRSRWGEIDIIAARGGVTYFVEVKTRRGSYLPPAANVDKRKRGQIARMAAQWFAEQGEETESALLVAEVLGEDGPVRFTEDFLC